MSQYVALLRGINVGANKRIGMADLRLALTAAGFEDVRTLLQSGNVVLTGSGSESSIGGQVEKVIAEEFGFDVGVVVRSAKQVAAVCKADPLGDIASDESKYMVVFCSTKPKAAAVRSLGEMDFGEERMAVKGKDIYAWCPGGTQNSKLFKAIENEKVAPLITVRNWRTVGKLLELTRSG
ncbi:MAG: DUF1697 domain-containing protein [Solirubrobacterales bacterium]